ncbi:hypothetical protein FO519_010369 [Halicephalobus sp. NKZ332]|nr:hypothetical protein FO519_010369 [Halicephalobus sp. NKZ332]
MPGTDGNKIEQNPDSMKKALSNSGIVYPTIEAALDPTNGVISQITNKFTAPSVTCSGFGIFHSYYVPAYADIHNQIMDLLNIK